MRDWRHATVDRVARGVLWFFRLVKGWLPRVLGGAASLSFVIWGVLGGAAWTNGVWLFWTGIGLAVAAFIAEFVVQRPSYMKLSQLREEAERNAAIKSDALERAMEILLVKLGHYCRLEGHSDRLSVYAFHEDQFFLVSRHAKNPVYDARGRPNYPADQGAIGKAWAAEHGQALVTMPASRDAWNRSAKRQGMSDEAIATIKMRSLGFAGHRLEAADRSVGVLMIESTTHGRIKQEHLDRMTESHIAATVAELVAAFAMMTPAGESFVASSITKPPRKWQDVSSVAGQTVTSAQMQAASS